MFHLLEINSVLISEEICLHFFTELYENMNFTLILIC